MNLLGITQQTAGWILGKPRVVDEIDAILRNESALAELRGAELVEGPIRLSASENGDLLLLWHLDYLSGTGAENWGFIQLSGEYGLLEHPDISREVIERCLYVINQRLQGYLIDGAYIHRAHANGAHTCLAGRGTEARQYSIGYIERDLLLGASGIHTILCLGPSQDLVRLPMKVVEEAGQLRDAVALAGRLIDPSRRRRVAPTGLLPSFREAFAPYLAVVPEKEYSVVKVPTGAQRIADHFRTAGWNYLDWIAPESPLSAIQRRLINSDAIEQHPIRIVGPGGSGKTLLMQLLALRRVEVAKERQRPVRILYLAHNSKMAETVSHRFSVLQERMPEQVVGGDRLLVVQTLAEYGRAELGLSEYHVIDPDAHEAKEFQLEVLGRALRDAMEDKAAEVASSPLLREVQRNPPLFPVLVRLVMAEISTAIKGHGLAGDKKRYVQSERRLSRLHGILTAEERKVIFDAFQRYHAEIFEGYGVLDSDDVALSLLGKLRTPIWELKRRELGFDFVFVDETQLFNENERRVFPLLARGTTSHVPIVLALDEAQDIYGQSTAGLGTLGIENVTSESLSAIHRSTRAIVKLAFFVIQRSTDLFGPDFPDFTGIAENMEDDKHPLAANPRLELMAESHERLGRFVLKRLRAMRKANLRRIAVICFADQYWTPVLDDLKKSDLELKVLERRGERLPASEPVVVLGRPAYIGGQEFDGVVLVGLEQGLTPPRVVDNDALAVAVEQQAFREMYLGITRARYQLVVVLPAGALPTPVLADAERVGLIRRHVC